MSTDSVESESLESLATRIKDYADRADEQLLEAAKLMLEARRRVQNGEAGAVTWESWARENIKLSSSRQYELLRIAEATDPHKELEHLRKKNRERQQAYRERQRDEKKSIPSRNGGSSVKPAPELEAPRQRLIAWAGKAPLDHVAKVLTYIKGLEASDGESASGETTETAEAA